VTGNPEVLVKLQRHLERAESDLRGEGFDVDRCITPAGALLSDQAFDAEVLILVLYGSMEVQSSETTVTLVAGDRLQVPSGVPYALRTAGESNVYWLHARRKDPIDGASRREP
jgi:quercetin dioxygenase-like cupin family protein